MKTIVDVLRGFCESAPERITITLQHPDQPDIHITYRELVERSNDYAVAYARGGGVFPPISSPRSRAAARHRATRWSRAPPSSSTSSPHWVMPPGLATLRASAPGLSGEAAAMAMINKGEEVGEGE